MPRFNRDKYITEGSYPSDLNDPVVMNKDKKSLSVISNFLGIDWDDEITVILGKEGQWYTPRHYVETDEPNPHYAAGSGIFKMEYVPTGEERKWMQYGERALSYLIEGTDPDGQEVIFLRKNTPFGSAPVLFIGDVQVNPNKIVQAAKTGDSTFKEVRQPSRSRWGPLDEEGKADLDWS